MNKTRRRKARARRRARRRGVLVLPDSFFASLSRVLEGPGPSDVSPLWAFTESVLRAKEKA